MRRAVALVVERIRGDAAILAFAGVGFLLTLAYGGYLAPDWDPIRDDQQEYLALARGIVATGEYTRATGTESFVPEPLRLPGYPIFIAPLCVRGCSMWGITFVQAIVVAILVVIVAKFAATLIGKRGGVIAGGMVALNPSFAFFGAHALSDVLGTVLMVGSVAAAAMLIPSRRAGGLFAGVLFAGSVLTRPLFVVALPVTMLAVALRHGLRRTAAPLALLVIVFALAVAPYVAYTESAFGRPLVGSSGTQLWMAYFEVRGSLDAMERDQEAAGRAALARFAAISDRAEQSRAWIVLDDELRARAVTLIAHDPWGFAARGVLRSAVLWTGDVPLRAEHITPTTAALWRVGGLTWFLVGFLGAVFMVRRGDPLTALPLLVILATWAVSYPLWAEGRYSLPAQPFVAIGLAAMLVRLRSPAPRGAANRAVLAR
ncbi:MAG: glycosyltransferase family 39 protein [Chloroflexi bacterium]|nr:MAG: glycosyltransferase family 39 protein [Chloroflexota bacterium]